MPPSIQETSSRSVGGSRAYKWTEEEGEGGGGVQNECKGERGRALLLSFD